MTGNGGGTRVIQDTGKNDDKRKGTYEKGKI